MVAPPGLEPGLSALKGPRVNQLHHGATLQLYAVGSPQAAPQKRRDLVALPGLEPGLFALRGRRVNQLHHNAKTARAQEDVLSSAFSKYSRFPIPHTRHAAIYFGRSRGAKSERRKEIRMDDRTKSDEHRVHCFFPKDEWEKIVKCTSNLVSRTLH